MPADRSKASAASDGDHRPLSSTCLACRQRKVKCDSVKPCCGNCVQAGLSQCVYTERQKPGLKPGIGTALVERVATLETSLSQQTQRIDELYARLGSTPNSLLIPSPPHIEQPNASATPSFTGTGPSSVPVDRFSQESPMSTASFVENADLPPHDLVLHLIDLFFQYVAPFAPFLLRELSASNSVPTHGGLSQPGWPITVYAMVVTSLRFSFDERWRMPGMPTKEHYYQAAKQRVVMHAIESTSLQSLQALAIIALDAIGTGAGPSAWGVLALLTRSITHLGLQSEEDTAGTAQSSLLARLSLLRQAKDFQEEEERRRLFWIIYLLDRWASASTGWEFAVTDQIISRNLPCREEFWINNTPVKTRAFRSTLFDDGLAAEEGPLDPLAYTIEIADMLGRVHQLHRQALNPLSEVEVTQFIERTRTLDAALRRWYSRLPLEVSTPATRETRLLIVMVQALFHTTVIKLQSFLAAPPDASPYMQPSAEASDQMFHSAKQIAALAAVITQDAEIPHTSPILAWCLWVASRVLIIRGYHSGTAVDPAINDVLQTLEVSGLFWDVARRYSVVLRKALNKLQEHDPYRPATSASNGRSSVISVLLDMRRTAFVADQAVPASGTETPANVAANDDYNKMLDGMLANWPNGQSWMDMQWFELPDIVM